MFPSVSSGYLKKYFYVVFLFLCYHLLSGVDLLLTIYSSGFNCRLYINYYVWITITDGTIFTSLKALNCMCICIDILFLKSVCLLVRELKTIPLLKLCNEVILFFELHVCYRDSNWLHLRKTAKAANSSLWYTKCNWNIFNNAQIGSLLLSQKLITQTANK